MRMPTIGGGNRIRRLRPLAAVAAMVVVTAGAVVGATPAVAAQGCGGTLVGQYVYGDDNFAQVDVYLENGTTNCLVNRTRDGSWGQAAGMAVAVSKSSADIPSAGSTNLCSGFTDTATRQADCSNSYAYYAGPVRIYAPNSCISFGARANTGGWIQHAKWANRHCG
ncbi:hypothetical protein L6E12_15470 [Actinokineospora sp. PR83]|uniref:hypothetical protein n=1 Tax=Actinokineospora sp. PR83 TaxID=2884908 RepID=UPI001F25F766|nr:hypothetical protein [Actinokineospora sp. PR83]MCG8917185.1 hypothetical protein [Actinokineospora sp. PR83]